MAGNKYALSHILSLLSNGPASLPTICDYLNTKMGYMQPSNMEVVGLLKPKNGIVKLGDGNYSLASDSSNSS